MFGSFLYSIPGLLYYGDALWMFHQNPYSGAELKYGSGEWLHYLEQLPYVVGFPFYVLVVLGVFDGFWRMVKGRMSLIECLVVYGIPAGYITAHSIFWAEGWFHSFGLNRVLIVIIPLLAVIAYRGIERISCALPLLRQKWIHMGYGLLLLIFPFTSNKAALNLPKSYSLEPRQLLIHDVSAFLDSSGYAYTRIYYGNTYVPFHFGLDIDQPKEAQLIGYLKNHSPAKGSIVIWDSYFSVTDQEVDQPFLDEHPELDHLKTFKCPSCDPYHRIELYAARSR